MGCKIDALTATCLLTFSDILKYSINVKFILEINKMDSQRNDMTEQQTLDLLLSIQESSSSKQWSDGLKDKILKKIPDKDLKNYVKQAWVDQQLQEVQSDPLEQEVVDENGKCLANRAWKCQARNCRYQPFRGNCLQLAIKAAEADHEKLAGKYTEKFVCLKHYRVEGQDNDYCHTYFKIYKKLPVGAYLKVNKQIQKARLPQPRTSAATNSNDRDLDSFVPPVDDEQQVQTVLTSSALEVAELKQKVDLLTAQLQLERQQKEHLQAELEHKNIFIKGILAVVKQLNLNSSKTNEPEPSTSKSGIFYSISYANASAFLK
jgi:hypothetical protein